MEINGKKVSIDEIYNDLNLEHSFLKRRENGLMLNDYQIEILKQNNIDYQNYSNLSSLLFELNEYLNENSDLESSELEEIYGQLQEIHYYQETKK